MHSGDLLRGDWSQHNKHVRFVQCRDIFRGDRGNLCWHVSKLSSGDVCSRCRGQYMHQMCRGQGRNCCGSAYREPYLCVVHAWNVCWQCWIDYVLELHGQRDVSAQLGRVSLSGMPKWDLSIWHSTTDLHGVQGRKVQLNHGANDGKRLP